MVLVFSGWSGKFADSLERVRIIWIFSDPGDPRGSLGDPMGLMLRFDGSSDE